MSTAFGTSITFAGWADVIWEYARHGRNGITYREAGFSDETGAKQPLPADKNLDDVIATISESGMAWIDKHLCPYVLWNDPDQDGVKRPRRKSRQFCKYTCTEQSIEHIALALTDTYSKGEDPETGEETWTYIGSGVAKEYYAMLLNKLFSALSAKYNDTGFIVSKGDFNETTYVLSKPPTSYVTIDYHDGDNGPVTGSLKIVVLDEKVSTDRADTALYADNNGVSDSGKGLVINP